MPTKKMLKVAKKANISKVAKSDKGVQRTRVVERFMKWPKVIKRMTKLSTFAKCAKMCQKLRKGCERLPTHGQGSPRLPEVADRWQKKNSQQL